MVIGRDVPEKVIVSPMVMPLSLSDESAAAANASPGPGRRPWVAWDGPAWLARRVAEQREVEDPVGTVPGSLQRADRADRGDAGHGGDGGC